MPPGHGSTTLEDARSLKVKLMSEGEIRRQNGQEYEAEKLEAAAMRIAGAIEANSSEGVRSQLSSSNRKVDSAVKEEVESARRLLSRLDLD